MNLSQVVLKFHMENNSFDVHPIPFGYIILVGGIVASIGNLIILITIPKFVNICVNAAQQILKSIKTDLLY